MCVGTGLDLSSIRCNVVDAESSGRRRRSEPTAFRVHQFASITHLDNSEALTAELKALAARGSFSRRAWVNLWDVRSSHQYLLLPAAPDAELESRARRHGASVIGMSDLDVTVSTSIGGDARRARPSSEARSVILCRRYRGHSCPFEACCRCRISRRGCDDPLWCVVVAGAAAARLVTWCSARTCRARRVAVGAWNLRRRLAFVCERSRLGLCGAIVRCSRCAGPGSACGSSVDGASAVVPLSEAGPGSRTFHRYCSAATCQRCGRSLRR